MAAALHRLRGTQPVGWVEDARFVRTKPDIRFVGWVEDARFVRTEPDIQFGIFWGISMPNYRRLYVPGGTYFFTVVTRSRRQFLTMQLARKLLGTAIRNEQKVSPFEAVAIVLLPDHFHCIWTLPSEDDDYPTRMKHIKRNFTFEYLKNGGVESEVSVAKRNKHERGVWQSRFWEHTVRDEDDFKRCLDYIHWNPVKHGYVTRPCDYPYSTFHKFVRIGEYELLWGTGKVVVDVPGAEWE
jgi:putative transposase